MIDALSPEQVSDEAALLPIQDIVAYPPGAPRPAHDGILSGVKDPKMVARWISRQNLPRDEAQIRLREGYQATRLVVDAYGNETAKAWLFGSNAELGSQAPAYVLARRVAGRICARSCRLRASHAPSRGRARCCAARSPAHQAAPRSAGTARRLRRRLRVAASALPPCASAIVRTIARPSPARAGPALSGREKRVNARAMKSGGKPDPASRT